MRVSLKAIKGVDKVDVGLNSGIAKVTFKPGNRVKLKQLFEAVATHGFTIKRTRLAANGSTITKEGRVLFVVAGSHEFFALEATDRRGLDGSVLLIEGEISEVFKGKPPVLKVLQSAQAPAP